MGQHHHGAPSSLAQKATGNPSYAEGRRELGTVHDRSSKLVGLKRLAGLLR